MEAWEYDLLKKEELERVDEDTLSEAADEATDFLVSFLMDELKENGYTPTELGALLSVKGDVKLLDGDSVSEGMHYAINEARAYYNSNNIYHDELIEDDDLFKNEILSEINKRLEAFDEL